MYLKKIRVLHVAPGFLYGGIEMRLIDWYKNIDHNLVHFDVVKVTPDVPNPLVDALREMGVGVYSIPPLSLSTAFEHIRQIKHIVTVGHYDVIHCHSLSYAFFPFIFSKKLGGQKRILHSRTTQMNGKGIVKIIDILLSNMAKNEATDYFACSKEAGKFAFGPNCSFHVVNNGIILSDFNFNLDARKQLRERFKLEGYLVLGFVGRFTEAKNIPFLFEVFGKIHKEDAHTKLLLVGDEKQGTIYNEVIEIANRYESLNDIIFVGRQNNVSEWMSAMDVFLMPSLYEGFGTVAVEAQATGLPCFVSDKIPRTIDVGGNISFLPINNTDVDEWAREILKLKGKKRDSGNHDLISQAGFDAKKIGKWLEEYYLSDQN